VRRKAGPAKDCAEPPTPPGLSPAPPPSRHTLPPFPPWPPKVRRKADPAKDLAKTFMRKWQDNPAVAGEVTHDEMKSALGAGGRGGWGAVGGVLG
jgi:hypothetical protein